MDPKRKQWFDEVDRFETLNLRKLNVRVSRRVVINFNDANLWDENERGLRYFVQMGVSIDAIFRFCKLAKDGWLKLHNVPLHLYRNSLTFKSPC